MSDSRIFWWMFGAGAITALMSAALPYVTGIVDAGKVLLWSYSAEEYARQVLEHDLETGVTARRPISEVIREIWVDIPAEVRAKLPADGASQVDHYVYGLPKRLAADER